MSERQSKLEELFHIAADLPLHERDAYLAAKCGDDAGLAADVRALLSAAHLDLEGFMARMASETANEPQAMPERIGQYQVIRVIGEGGMGRVYEARQESPERHVALKVIRPGFVSSSVLRRFAHEANILAQLNHPGIAQIFQAGFSTDPSRPDDPGARMPYFAMELVKGSSLTEFCRSQLLSDRAVLELMARICDAVQHAHQRGVIHRDLKPGNILVSMVGDRPEPKILDFGIARLTDQEHVRATMQTQVGQIIGTLGYMSPEQTDGAAAAVDTRTDVYALGVMLYELLAKRLPHDLANRSIAAAIAIVRDAEPPLLGQIRSELRGDIEIIVGKAMAKEPERRYSTAAELASDLRSVLDNRPINARPPSTLYVARKFARRNRVVVGALVLAAVSVCVGTGLAVWQAIVATRQRDAAVLAESRSNLIKQFLIEDVFGQTRMGRGEGGVKLTVVDALSNAATRVPEKFASQPELRGEIQAMLTIMMTEAAMMPEAAIQAAEAQRTLTAAYGENDRRTLHSILDRAVVLQQLGREDELTPPISVLSERIDAICGPLSIEALKARSLLGVSFLQANKPEEAERVLHDTLKRPFSPSVKTHIAYGYALNVMTAIKRGQGQIQDALNWSQQSVEWMAANQPPDSPNRLAINASHGNLLMAVGRLDEAEAVLRDILARQQRLLKPGDDDLAHTSMHLAMLLERQGRPEEALPLIRKGSQAIEQIMGVNKWETWTTWRHEWFILSSIGDPVRLDAWHQQLIAKTKQMSPEFREHYLDAIRWYADFKLDQGAPEEAERLFAPVRSELLSLPEDAHTRQAAEVVDAIIAGKRGITVEARQRLAKSREFFQNRPFPLFPKMVERIDRALRELGDAPATPLAPASPTQ